MRCACKDQLLLDWLPGSRLENEFVSSGRGGGELDLRRGLLQIRQIDRRTGGIEQLNRYSVCQTRSRYGNE